MVPIHLSQHIGSYYQANGEIDKAKKQSISNDSLDSLHPIASLKFVANGTDLVVEFFVNQEKALSARIKKLNEGGVKQTSSGICIQENSIYHAGYLYSAAVDKMTTQDKEHFISNIPSMKVYNIDFSKRCISLW